MLFLHCMLGKHSVNGLHIKILNSQKSIATGGLFILYIIATDCFLKYEIKSFGIYKLPTYIFKINNKMI